MALSRQQQHIARTIIRVGRSRGATPKELKAAIETGIVESNLSNPRGGDGTSVGWRQETASSYPNVNRLDVAGAAKRFFSETAQVRGKYAKAGDLAQAVQRSAFPGRYAQASGEAQQILRRQGGSGGGGGGLSTTTSTTTTTPGVDNSAARQQLAAQFLAGNHSSPVGGDLLQGLRSSNNAGQNLSGLIANLAQNQDIPGSSMTVRRQSPSGSGGGSPHRGVTGGVIGHKTFLGVDMGNDFGGKGPIPAHGDAVITRVSPQNSGTGWPGQGDAGHGNRGAIVVYKLLHPPDAKHRFIYVAENIDPHVRVGQRVRAGQAVARARGAFPYLETGWALDAHGTPLAHGHADQNTAAGRSFKRFLRV